MNEPKLIKKNTLTEMIIAKQKKYLIIAIFCVITLFVGASYALLTNFDKTDDVVTFKTGNLNMTVNNTLINLEGKLPESDTNGLQNATPITLTLTNTGTMFIDGYEVKLVSDKNQTSTLDESYIKYAISEDGTSYSTPSILTENSNIIFTGYDLEVDASKTIYLKVWVDEAAGNNALDKTYYGSIEVELYQYKEKPLLTFVQTVKNNLGTGGLFAINTNGESYDAADASQIIREYRYRGVTASDVDNNVYFNCASTDGTYSYGEEDYDYTNNCEIWRIVGVFNEKLKDGTIEEFVKIVREEVLEAEMIPETYLYNEITYTLGDLDGGAYWNNPDTLKTTRSDWTLAGLQFYLNTEYDQSTTKEKGYLSTLYPQSLELIRTTTYYLGNINPDSDTGNTVYKNERTESNIHDGNEFTWSGKVALLYPSDIKYMSTDNGELNKVISTTIGTWLNTKINASEWLLSPGNYSTQVTRVDKNSSVNSYGTKSITYLVRPTLHLVSNTLVLTGDGTNEKPFVVGLPS